MFSVIGFFYVKNRGKGGVAGRFIPRRKAKDRDFLKIARENAQKSAGTTDNSADGLTFTADETEEGIPEQEE